MTQEYYGVNSPEIGFYSVQLTKPEYYSLISNLGQRSSTSVKRLKKSFVSLVRRLSWTEPKYVTTLAGKYGEIPLQRLLREADRKEIPIFTIETADGTVYVIHVTQVEFRDRQVTIGVKRVKL